MRTVVLTERLKHYMRKEGALGIRVYYLLTGVFPHGTAELQANFIWDQPFVDARHKSYDVEVETDVGIIFFDPELEYWKRTVTLDLKRFLFFNKITVDGAFVRTGYTSVNVPRSYF